MRLTPLDPWIAEKIGLPGQKLTRAALEAHQLRRLNATLAIVREHSTFYRTHLAAAQTSLTSLQDLATLPFTTAQDIRANPFAFVCVSQDSIKRVVTLDTSGTSGKPKRIYFTEDDQELTIDFFRVGMSTFTQPGDRVLILLPGETPGSVGDLLAIGLARLGAIPIKHGPVRDAGQTLKVIEAEAINGMVGVPTHVLSLVRDPAFQRTNTVRNVLLSTDHVPNAIKRAIEQAWDCKVYNHYGMTETGLGGGVECQARVGYHLREADLYYEIINPQTGQPVPDGEEGEVVFTTLTRQGMPLVRYRTGDLGRLLPDACACGTALKTLARITTRLDGLAPIGHSLLAMADLDEAVFSVEGVLNFTAAMARDKDGNQLHLGVKLVYSNGVTLQEIRQALETLPALRSEISTGRLSIALEAIGSIPPSMAKRAII